MEVNPTSHKYLTNRRLTFQAQTPLEGSNSNTAPIVIPSSILNIKEPLLAKGDAKSEIMGASNGNNLINEINTYRRIYVKEGLIADEGSCAFASTRASEITADFSHSGFDSRRDSNSLPYVNWTKVVENIAMSTNGINAVEMWKSSPTHNANLLSDITFGCVQNSGNYYVFEGWKN